MILVGGIILIFEARHNGHLKFMLRGRRGCFTIREWKVMNELIIFLIRHALNPLKRNYGLMLCVIWGFHLIIIMDLGCL